MFVLPQLENGRVYKAAEVACDVQSPEMWAALNRVLRLEPDLCELIKELPQMPLEGVEVPDFLDDE